MKEEDLREIFNRAQAIPYAIPLTRDEPNRACVGKHLVIKEALDLLGHTSRWGEGTFHWHDLPVPEYILKLRHRDPDYHVWLEVNIYGTWKVIDATWDPGLSSVFPVNAWDDFGQMKLAFPIQSRVPYEEVIVTVDPPESYEDEIVEQREFILALNTWLEKVRL